MHGENRNVGHHRNRPLLLLEIYFNLRAINFHVARKNLDQFGFEFFDELGRQRKMIREQDQSQAFFCCCTGSLTPEKLVK